MEKDPCHVETRAELAGSAPGTVRIEGGSVGFHIGGSQTDLIMLVMNERGAGKLLSSTFTLGAQGSVAAGPVGRTAPAQTDAQMHAEILSWSRSQGLFAVLAVEGATLRQDLDDNATLYGKRLGEPRRKTINPWHVNVKSGLAVTALRAVEREIQ